MQIHSSLICCSLFLFSWVPLEISSVEHERCFFQSDYQKDQSILELTLKDLFLYENQYRQFLLWYCDDYFKVIHRESFFPSLGIQDLNAFVLTEHGLLIILQNYIFNIMGNRSKVLLIPYSILDSFIDSQDPMGVLQRLSENDKVIEYDEKTLCFLEEQIPALAEAALKQAYWQALASGSSVLIEKNGFLVEIYPDGTEKIIKELPPSTPVISGETLKIR